MSSQELVELQKIKKIIKKQVRVVRKKAKKIKVKDLFSAESFNERAKAFLDKLTLDDLLQLSAIIGIAIVIKTGIQWSDALRKAATIFDYILNPDFLTVFFPIPKEEPKPSPEWLEWLISIGTAYIIVKHFPAVVKAGSDIISTAKTILGAVAAG